MRATALAALLLPLATPLLAEGARLELACEEVTSCRQDGTCEPGDGPVSFTIAPLDTDDEGAGRYRITAQDDTPHEARGLSRTGPFHWVPAPDGRMTLILTGEDSALWVRQLTDTGSDTPPWAAIDMLRCEVTF